MPVFQVQLTAYACVLIEAETADAAGLIALQETPASQYQPDSGEVEREVAEADLKNAKRHADFIIMNR